MKILKQRLIRGAICLCLPLILWAQSAHGFKKNAGVHAKPNVSVSANLQPIFYAPLSANLTALVPGSSVNGSFTRASTAWYVPAGATTYSMVITDTARFEDDGLLREGAATNRCLYARDFTNAAWNPTDITPAKDQIGIDGSANIASSLLATGTNGVITQTITLGSAARTFSVFVKRITGTGTVSITDNNGTNWTDITSSLSTTVWYRAKINRTQADPVVGLKLATSGDKVAVDMAQVEESDGFVTSPIPTTSSAVSRATEAGTTTWTLTSAILNSLSTAQGDADSLGTFCYEWTPQYNEAQGSGNAGFIAQTEAIAGLFYTAHSSRIKSWDGTSEVLSPNLDWANNTTYKVCQRWNNTANARQIIVGGSAGTAGAYDGAFVLGTDLILWYSNNYPGHIRNLRWWDVDKGTAWCQGATQ